jgi:thiol-disulfide isomerase/thioredoxin
MKYVVILLMLLFVDIGFAQRVPVLNFSQVEQHYSSNSDTVYVVNFWATWCKPCIEELPAFLKVEQELKSTPFKLILVSLDFPQHINTRVIPFLDKHGIKSDVYVLDDDANQWINKVNPDWDGSIPATLVVKKKTASFFNQTFEYDELLKLVKPKLN